MRLGPSRLTPFARYDVAGHLAEPAPHVAAWLTGQSSLRHSLLSPEQDAMLDHLAILGFRPVRAGFPWNSAALGEPYRREPVVGASVRNGAQFLAARLSRRFGRDAARHLGPLVERTSRRLLLVCGSAGAEILTAAVAHLGRTDGGPRVLAVALGPVGRLPAPDSGVTVHVIRGDRDPLSRWACRAPADRTVRGGHLDYAASPQVHAEVLRVAREFLA